MDVQEIESLDQFEQLHSAWDDVYAADPQASVFMSWPWLRGWFEVTPDPWSVLSVRASVDGPWLGFLPISYRGSRSRVRFDHLREVHLAGEPAADHAGMLCRPETEEPVIEALADYLSNEMPWERLRFHEVWDPRMPRLLAKLVDDPAPHDRQGTPCPYVPLPATWEEYLAQLTYETRKSLRKRMKAAEAEWRVERLDATNIDRQIDSLMALANARQRENQDPNTWRLHAPLRRCAQAGLAWVVMIWEGDVPVAGIGSFVDRKHDSLCTYVTSYDGRFGSKSPGRVVNALCIRDAIETLHVKTLDFLRGEEPYKYQFASQTRHNRTYMIERDGGMSTAVRKAISALRDRLRVK